MIGLRGLTDSWTENPGVVEIALPSLNQQDLEVVIEICKSRFQSVCATA